MRSISSDDISYGPSLQKAALKQCRRCGILGVYFIPLRLKKHREPHPMQTNPCIANPGVKHTTQSRGVCRFSRHGGQSKSLFFEGKYTHKYRNTSKMYPTPPYNRDPQRNFK